MGPLPIPQGSLVKVSVTKGGKLRLDTEVSLIDGQPLSLPALRDDPLFGFLVGLGMGHLPGIRLGAHFHIPGAWLFMPVDDYLSLSLPEVKGEATLLREEGWLGLGTYLFFPPGARFRLGIETRGGLALSLPTSGGLAFHPFIDPLVEPISIFGEFLIGGHLTARLEAGSVYAFGLGDASAMSTGWLRHGAPGIDLALEWKP